MTFTLSDPVPGPSQIVVTSALYHSDGPMRTLLSSDQPPLMLRWMVNCPRVTSSCTGMRQRRGEVAHPADLHLEQLV